MLLSVWRGKCDTSDCQAVAVWGQLPNTYDTWGWNGDLGDGWYLSTKGRTANMTFCPKHADKMTVPNMENSVL